MKKKLIAGFFALFLLATPAFAQYDQISIPTDEITPSPTSAPKEVNYDLPYPGLLPGNPLYSLKALRDKIEEIAIINPMKKSNFYLLQADKRFAASLKLFGLGKDELAEHTLSKSQNYLEKSLDEAIKAKKQQGTAGDLFSRIRTSAQNQMQDIKSLGDQNNGELRQKLNSDLKRAQNLRNLADKNSK